LGAPNRLQKNKIKAPHKKNTYVNDMLRKIIVKLQKVRKKKRPHEIGQTIQATFALAKPKGIWTSQARKLTKKRG
jgi:hypothetical protein